MQKLRQILLTKNKTAYIAVFIFFISQALYSQDAVSGIEQADNDSCSLFAEAPLLDSAANDKDDSLRSDTRIPLEEFKYADNQRYTLDGKPPYQESNINYARFAGITGFYTAVFIAQHIGQSTTIWSDKSDFRIMEDGEYALWADKAGHFFGTYYVAYIFAETFMWTGLSYDASVVAGSLMGLAYNTYVEILDGFGANWGFSPSDFYSDILGSGFYLAQNYVPVLQNFTPKFTYVPSEWNGDKRRREAEIFIDDYSSHTLWMSVNVNNLLPDQAKPYWPDWLQLSFGYAVRNLCGPTARPEPCDPSISEPVSDKAWGNRKFIISLDYDLVKLLPDGPPFWNWFKQSINMLKFPAPAIEFGSETQLYLIYPFSFKLNLSKAF